MGKRQELRKKRAQKQQNQKKVVLISVIVLAVLVTAVIIYQSTKPIGEILVLEDKTRPETDGLTMGNPNASVVVEEFGDFQCVACYRFWQSSEQQLIENYVATGEVLLKFVPFSFIGEESFQAAEAAFCANEEGRFWDYHDMIYLNWNGENTGNFSDKRLVAFAASIGLDENSFRTCLNSNRFNSDVQQAIQYGRSLGVSATPTFNVNGQLVYSDELFSKIDELLGN